jgi:hypothetical protein
MFSCSTAAQRQASFIRENDQVAKQKLMDCLHKVEINPDYHSLAEHMPIRGNVNPTLEQLADNGLPTDQDIRVIFAFHNEAEYCRLQLIEDYMKFIPGIVPTLTQFNHQSNLISVDLIQKKITWGEANKRRLALKDEYRGKIQAFFEQLDRDLAASHQSELAQRQEVSQALGAAATAIAPNSWGGRLGSYTSGQQPTVQQGTNKDILDQLPLGECAILTDKDGMFYRVCH